MARHKNGNDVKKKQAGNGARKRLASYDDVHKTLATDCKRLLIPLINEIFGTNYDDSLQNEALQQELMLQTEQEVKKRIADTLLRLTDDKGMSHKYHIESDSKGFISLSRFIFLITRTGLSGIMRMRKS